jgi:excisionase family DNA binding protein
MSTEELEGMEFIPVVLASRIMAVSQAVILKLIKEGELPAYRFGTAWRIDRQELMDFIQKSKHQKEE